MKITALQTQVLGVPTGIPISASGGSFDVMSYLVLTLQTDAGLEGRSHIQVPGRVGVRALRELIADFGELVLGRDPLDTDGFADLSWKRAFWLGQSGLWAFVTSALDVAMWDIAGQAAGQPLHRLWGGRCESVGVYGSGKMWLAQSQDSIVAEAREFIAQGFRAIKMRVASPELQRDVERVASVRDAVGPGIELMVDCNQGLDLDRATQLARALEPYAIAWLEEPIRFDDVAGYAELRRRTGIPIATGENLYLPGEFDAFLAAGAVDVLMPDLQRCGGYTGMNRIASACASANVKFSPHAYAWHSTHSVAALAAEGGCVEWMPRGDPMFGRTTQLREGRMLLPMEPGTGLRYADDWLASHAER